MSTRRIAPNPNEYEPGTLLKDLHWKNPMEQLREIRHDDESLVIASRRNTNRKLLLSIAAELYVRYMVTSNQLDECYKLIVQPQIRILIKKTLTCVYGRIFELKQILINKGASIFTPIMSELSSMEILYDQFELKIPEYFREGRQLFLNDMDNEIDNIQISLNVEHNNDESDQLQTEINITEGKKSSIGQSVGQGKTKSVSVNVNEGKSKEITFSEPDYSMAELIDEIRGKQNTADMMLIAAINTHEEHFNHIHKPIIMDKIIDILQAHIWVHYKRDKTFPSWPDDPTPMFTQNDESTLIASNAVLNNLSEMYDLLEYHKRVPLGGSAIFRVDSWTTKTAEIVAPLIVGLEKKSTKENKPKKKNKNADTDENDVLEPSNLTEWFKEVFDEFDKYWSADDDVLEAKPKEDLINYNIFVDNLVELRVMAYTTTQDHFEMLKKAEGRDLGKKYAPPKTKKKKPKKRSSKRSKKKSAPLTLEEILKEFVTNDMVKKSTTAKFDEFLGEVSYCADTLREQPHNYDSPYCLGDLRQIIKEQYVIGLIFPELRTFERIQFHSSLLLAGPEKSGKTLLINALCTETGSLKIKLNFMTLSQNYPDNKKIKVLVQKIIKFAQDYQPVVIEVDLADVPFYKKIPKNLKPFKPKLMERLLLSLLKGLNKTDRVIVIGKATSPWLTDADKLNAVFKTILFTVPDYKTIFHFIKDLMKSYSTDREEIPISLMTRMMFGYPRQVIADMVASVMTAERMATLDNDRLDPKEFIPEMIKIPKNPKMCDEYHDWYRKFVPLGIRKTLEMEMNVGLIAETAPPTNKGKQK